MNGALLEHGWLLLCVCGESICRKTLAELNTEWDRHEAAGAEGSGHVPCIEALGNPRR
jgi:hypothetical protein